MMLRNDALIISGSLSPIACYTTALPTCHLRCMSNNLIFLIYVAAHKHQSCSLKLILHDIFNL
jgi:hypothetical protein